MQKSTRGFLISSLTLITLLTAILLAINTDLLSDIKHILLNTTPQADESKPIITPNFEFEFLSDPLPVALNDRSLPDNQQPLIFLVAGHIYGKPSEDESHPAATLLTNIEKLKSLDPDLVVLLGDLVWRPTTENFDQLERMVLDQFAIPVFNAVGNHDVTKRELYQERFGHTVYAFRYKNQLFIILDTTLKYYHLTQEQYSFISEVIEDQSFNITGINIFMHHVLFLEAEEVVSKKLSKPNEGNGRSEEFLDFIETELAPISEIIPVYIYAGDVGAFEGGNLSPLFKIYPKGNITFLATGLGENSFDSVLVIENSKDGSYTIHPFSLTDQELGSIDQYSLPMWFKR